MTYQDYQTLTINGETLSGSAIADYCRNSTQENIRQLGAFIEQWLSESPTLQVQTSGSTGKPKVLAVGKNQMLMSASMTADYFGFKPGQTALLALPMSYIAGKMMVVRALYSDLNLLCVEPSRDVLGNIEANKIIDFAPLIPLQLSNVTQADNMRKILLGGSSIEKTLEEKLQGFSSEIYQGYGMTETLSHVALRRINSAMATQTYDALSGVSFEVDSRDCLIIHTPFLHGPVHTNDVVELKGHYQFIWRARADNVVNSGSIKLFPEEIEAKLHKAISDNFFVAGIPDQQLGQKLCLFIESNDKSENKTHKLFQVFSQLLDKYEKPKEIFFVKNFIYTESGKIKRKDTVNLALSH